MPSIAEQLLVYEDRLTPAQAQQIANGLLGLARTHAPCLPEADDGTLPAAAELILLRAGKRDARGLLSSGETVTSGPFAYRDGNGSGAFTKTEEADLARLCGAAAPAEAADGAPLRRFPLARPVVPEAEWASTRRW